MTAIIQLEHVTKRYQNRVVIPDLSLQVQRNEIFGLLGPNGAGKTTTLEMIEGLRHYDQGRIQVCGFEVANEGEEVKRRIGIQLQSTALFPNLNLLEMLDLYALFYNMSYTSRELEAQLEKFGLLEKRKSFIKQLSGGQKQRFSLALALINQPEILFLDEPSTGLDPSSRRDLWNLIRQLKDEGLTILLTTHYMEEAEFLCDRIGLMVDGQLKMIGTVEEIVNQANLEAKLVVPKANMTREVLQQMPAVSKVIDEGHQWSVMSSHGSTTMAALHQYYAQQGQGSPAISLLVPNLEDAFIQMTGRRLRHEEAV